MRGRVVAALSRVLGDVLQHLVQVLVDIVQRVALLRTQGRTLAKRECQ